MSTRTVPAAVIVCTRERPRLVQDAVRSILAGEVRPRELVVVDGSSSPHPRLGSGEASGGCRIVYVHTTVRSLSQARGLGATHADEQLLVYCDDDVLADPGWLAALVSPLEDGDPSTVATGRVVAGAPERRGAFVPALVLADEPAIYVGRIDRDVLAGGNSALFRATLDRVGGWDTRLGPGAPFPAAEDNDLGLRLLEAGCRIVYVPEAVLHHRSWRPRREYPLVRWRYGLGKGGFYAKHWRTSGIARRAARDVLRRLVQFPLMFWRRPFYAAGEFAYAAGVVVGTLRWSARRPSV